MADYGGQLWRTIYGRQIMAENYDGKLWKRNVMANYGGQFMADKMMANYGREM